MKTPAEVQAVTGNPERRIDKYVLVQQLGQGGTATVWKAWDLELSRFVTLKFPDILTPKQLERLWREAQLAAKLSHPNIAKIFDVCLERGKSYIAMEYIEGDVLDPAGLSVPEALQVMRDVALAIEYAHAHDVIHRDIKPGNIMRDSTGHVFVLDFGLAKPVEQDTTVTASGLILGTPSFMSPEQARGSKLGVRTDVYLLGATLYSLVTGHLPHEGTKMMEVIVRITRGDLLPPRSHNPKLHPDIEAIIVKAMEFDPARRYATAGEIAEDLRRFLDGEPISAKPHSAMQKLKRRVVRHKALSALIALLILVSLAGGTTALVITINKNLEIAEEKERTRAEKLKRAEEKAREADALQRDKENQEKAQPYVDDARHELELANRLIHGKDWDGAYLRLLSNGAREFAEQAIEIRPTDAEAHYILGTALWYLSDMEGAMAAFTRAIELKPTYLDPRRIRARLWMGQYLLARQPLVAWSARGASIQQAPAETPEQEELRLRVKREFEILEKNSKRVEPQMYAKAVVAMMNQRFPRAVQHFEALIRLSPLDADAQYLMGQSQLFARQLGEAQRHLERSIEIRPWFTPALRLLATCFCAQAKPDAAIETYDRLLTMSSRDLGALLNRGAAYGLKAIQENDPKYWERCLEDIDQVVRANPNHSHARYYRFIANKTMKNYDEALEDVEHLIRIEPDNPQWILQRGLTLAVLGRFKSAIEDLDEAAETWPRHEDIWSHKAMCHMQLGDFKTAITEFETLFGFRPDLKTKFQKYYDYCLERVK